MGKEGKNLLDEEPKHHVINIKETFGVADEVGGGEEELSECNGIITGVDISVDNNVLTMFIDIGMDEGKQSFGSLGFNTFGEDQKLFDSLGVFIMAVMRVTGIMQVAKLIGTPVRVRRTDKRIKELGHFVKNSWMDVDDFIKENKNG